MGADNFVSTTSSVSVPLIGITGPVKVDEVGNRVADFDLFDMKSPDTREFQVNNLYVGEKELSFYIIIS